MTTQQLLYAVFSFLPFVVCLFWLICFALHTKRNDSPKHYYTVYIGTCTILYLCHALFFTIGLSYEMECLWTMCSLSVYPLFYGYLCRLTMEDFSPGRMLLWLIPGAVVALAKYLLPDAGIDKARLVLFASQVVVVCQFGVSRLKAFDNELQSVYADTEGRDTVAVHHLLIAIIVVSILAGVANGIGKQFFGESLWLLIPISMAFSTMLFLLSYICYNRVFTVDQLGIDKEVGEQEDEPETPENSDFIGKKIEDLMVGQRFFMRKDLKIGDLVMEIGSNRTYVSNYINRTYNCSFSDYTNRLRIEHAKTLLLSSARGAKLSQIADESGFASEQSFYRNFKKIVGMTPADWVASQF